MSKKRVFVIIHLCFAFAYLFWIGLHPFLKHSVVRKSEGALFESVVTNEAHFEKLDPQLQGELKEGYGKWASDNKVPYRAYFSLSWISVLWLVLSLIITFFWLFKIEGAAPLAWLLPFVVIATGFYAGTAPKPDLPTFFPTEEQLSPYLEASEGNKRQERIVSAWHAYLNDHWAGESVGTFDERVDAGNFAFNVERVKWVLAHKKGDATLATTLFAPSALQFFLYLLWNGLFAWTLNRRVKSPALSTAS